jgi:SAM-dependent methyltransferase
MGDYTNMSAYYDVIMTSGYYNYAEIVDELERHGPFNSILEIGCGTGLILEEIGKRQPQTPILGIDLTQAMLVIAQERLKPFAKIKVEQQNVVEMNLARQFAVAFSYGGVWYFVMDGDKEPFLVSHIADHGANVEGLRKLAQSIEPGGTLLLGIQGPHFDYETQISNGMTYSQKIEPSPHGFLKSYYLADHDRIVMEQTIDYRVYDLAQTKAMFKEAGFTFAPVTSPKKFLAFTRDQ